MSIRRGLKRAVDEAPPPDACEEWLLDYPLTCEAPELAGPAFAMARTIRRVT